MSTTCNALGRVGSSNRREPEEARPGERVRLARGSEVADLAARMPRLRGLDGESSREVWGRAIEAGNEGAFVDGKLQSGGLVSIPTLDEAQALADERLERADEGPGAPPEAAAARREAVSAEAAARRAEVEGWVARAAPAGATSAVEGEDRARPGGAWAVKRRDTLSAIAVQVYGHPRAWRAIAEANRGIVRGTDTIRPGQELALPPRERLEALTRAYLARHPTDEEPAPTTPPERVPGTSVLADSEREPTGPDCDGPEAAAFGDVARSSRGGEPAAVGGDDGWIRGPDQEYGYDEERGVDFYRGRALRVEDEASGDRLEVLTIEGSGGREGVVGRVAAARYTTGRPGDTVRGTDELLSGRFETSRVTPDGAEGYGLAAVASLYSRERVLTWDANSVVVGASLGVGAEGSSGVRDIDHDGNPEQCVRLTVEAALGLTVGACVELPGSPRRIVRP